MFEKHEVRSFSDLRREDAWARSWDWWSRQGFQLTQTGPYRFHGSSFYSRIGLRREFDLAIDESGSGSSVDLSFRAQISDAGIIAGAVTAVLLFPVAVLGGAVSYTEYESDARNLMLAFWQHLGSPTIPPGVAALPSPCSACGAALLPDWKACPYCGRARNG